MKETTREYVNRIAKQVTDLMSEYGDDWSKPWATQKGGLPFNPARNARYTGGNVFGLMLQGWSAGFGESQWATYKQWKSIGKQVAEGQRSVANSIFYSKVIDEDKNSFYHVMKLSPVFNIEQTVGYEPIDLKDKENKVTKVEAVENFISKVPCKVMTHGNQAYYNPTDDVIVMPPEKAFIATEHESETENYYSTLLHELTHWTGHKSRLDRLDKLNSMEARANEELIAELGSILLSCELGVSKNPTPNHAKYLNHWITAIKDNPRVIIKAMAAAEKAASHLNQYQQQAIAAE